MIRYLLGLTTVIAVAGPVKTFDGKDRIVVADTGLPSNKILKPYLCKDGHADFTDTGIEDRIGHSTNIIGIIAKYINPKKACITVYKIYNSKEDNFESVFNRYANALINLSPKYVNLSFTGNAWIRAEYNTYTSLLASGTMLFVAAGNSGLFLSKYDCPVFPACYFTNHPNFKVVTDPNKLWANKGGPVNTYADGGAQRGLAGPLMQGTSQACAVAIGSFIRRVQSGIN